MAPDPSVEMSDANHLRSVPGLSKLLEYLHDTPWWDSSSSQGMNCPRSRLSYILKWIYTKVKSHHWVPIIHSWTHESPLWPRTSHCTTIFASDVTESWWYWAQRLTGPCGANSSMPRGANSINHQQEKALWFLLFCPSIKFSSISWRTGGKG